MMLHCLMGSRKRTDDVHISPHFGSSVFADRGAGCSGIFRSPTIRTDGNGARLDEGGGGAMPSCCVGPHPRL